jgi:hypothetical protein
MKKDKAFYLDMQTYIAITTIGPSTLRNQGSKGVIKAAQKYVASIDIRIFRAKDEAAFLEVLDQETENLRRALPEGAQNWGAARKALNLFLRDVCYNRFLCEIHGLAQAEDWMEIPLDSLISASLKRKSMRGQLPAWPGLNRLTPEVSSKFQAFARQVAMERRISRVHLDMRLWIEARERNGEQGALPARQETTPASR